MKRLLDANDEEVIVDEGESSDITATFKKKHTDTPSIAKASLITLTLTLFDKVSGEVINSRLDQNVKDLNGGAVASDGTLTLNLQPEDNVIVGDKDTEEHVARLKWTWTDGSLTKTGIEELSFQVGNLATVVS